MFFPIPAFRSFRQWMDTSSAFVRAWVRSPRSVGMVCPSGMPLARSMAAFAPRKGDGLVVELGAGTGPGSCLMRALLPGVWLWWSSPRLW